MKAYESVEAQYRLDTNIPVIARIDGRKFSKFTKNFRKPFDDRLTAAMDMTTARLVDQTHANIGYTQSDEITLVWHVDRSDNPAAQMLFDGRTQKLCSVLAGMATSYFTMAMLQTSDQYMICEKAVTTRFPHFDCRVWNVPDRPEAMNTLLWRWLDARKNAVSSFTRSFVSHKQMQGLNAQEQLDLAHAAGAPPFDEFTSPGERTGRFFQKRACFRNLTGAELAKIPPEHRPSGEVIRNEMWAGPQNWPELQNKEAFVFDKAVPEYA